MRRAAAAMIASLAGLSFAGPAPAGEFLFPVDCTLGQSCFIQHYMDRDPGPGVGDFGCGALSYDGHKGTDFALPTEAAMRDRVAVFAVADGLVRGLRDGVPDLGAAGSQAARAAGTECGNGVLIDHGDGLETQYCHLRRGSVSVSVGERVRAGARIGLIGQSGAADFPHLHLSVRRDGAPLDPYQPDAADCGAGTAQLWATPMGYVPTGLAEIGVTTAVPDYDALKRGDAQPVPAVQSPALVLWAVGFGSQPGDALQMRMTGPDGPVFDHTVPLERAQARYMRATGMRKRGGLWPAGPYAVHVTLRRNGQAVERREILLTLD